MVVNMTLVFKDQSSVPPENNATSALSSALTSNATTLNVIPGSVSTRESMQTLNFSNPLITLICLINNHMDLYSSSFLIVHYGYLLLYKSFRQFDSICFLYHFRVINNKQCSSACNWLIGILFSDTDGCGADSDKPVDTGNPFYFFYKAFKYR